MHLRHFDILDLGNGTAIAHGRCSFTGNFHATPPIPLQALKDYRAGDGHAQTLFPTLAGPEREFLISGTSPEGWRTGVLGLRPDSYGEPVEPTPPQAGGTTRVVIDRTR